MLGILTAMSYAGYLLSMRRARREASDSMPIPEVATVSILVTVLLQPALSLLWDALFFARTFTVVEALGIVLTLTAIYLGSQSRVS